ncbi:MAG: helix-turn-helix transcriptional regulator, partial [Paucibacter sp.]|nr:helix-turn-helix transcriptional regulator [Roseateles sp.]
MDAVSFGPFHLIPSARRLEKDGIPVKIGSRAFDILIQLVEQAGTPVGHKTLIERVWRGVVVEESSLRVNITGLRRALGDSSGGSQYVANVPGQGYCFVAPITHSSGAQAGSASVAAPAAYPLPAPLPRMVGRGELVPMLASQLLSQRFVTIVGPGGMGKTTTAIAIAHSLRADFADAVCFFDLGALSSPELLPNTMAATLGLPASANPQHSLAAWLQDKKFLLVFDNCEHLIDAVAMLAEQLHHAAPRLCILATSREALRVEGEYAHRLLPLECPPESVSLSAQEALAFPAVQLFVERARAGGHGFELHDAEVPLVAQICRQLDGIALAIELSAGRVAAFGVRGTAELLGSGSGLSWEGRRTAVPRHQTLNAMLDWSYKLLPECERKVLRRLSAFVGQFSLEGAIHVASDGPQDQSQVIAALGSLVGKSLATVENVASGCCYRLLDSTRMYVAEKLAASGEAQLAARR